MAKPRILVTNDDGIQAHELKLLAGALEAVGEVWVFAPDRQQSAVGHGVSLHRPLRVHKVKDRWFMVDGTPTDCVMLAVRDLMGARPDLVVSGINPGANLGDDVTYSGTVAGAYEGMLLGVPSFAISDVSYTPRHPETAAAFAATLARYVVEHGIPADTTLNVNVPDLPSEEIAGVSITRMGRRHYKDEIIRREDPRGGVYYWIGGAEPSHVADLSAVRQIGVAGAPLSTDGYVWIVEQLGRDVPLPEGGYVGAYMIDIARDIVKDKGERYLNKQAELGRLGMAKVIESIKKDLERLGVTFDVWFSEKTLYEKGQYKKAMALIKGDGFIVEKDGASWFASTSLGEDKDNVLVRSDGTPTYFASDIAYHYNKFIERKFEKVIDIWGADHQGHVSRMKAAVGALGIDANNLEIIISQMVTLKRGDTIVRASKRTGEMIMLSDLMDEVGTDACRFFFLSRSADSQMDFDMELAKKQSADNPVFYVQYAHARICSILRRAQEESIDYGKGDVSLLTSEPELALIRKMLELPEIIDLTARTLEPHHLPYYASDLATVFHNFYEKCRVVTDDKELTKARLQLVEATRIVLAQALHLMGMTAPEKM